jgi:hypothetical protein
MLGVTSEGSARAAVALPDNPAHRLVFGKAARSIHAAGIGAFWVDNTGRVTEVAMPWESA